MCNELRSWCVGLGCLFKLFCFSPHHIRHVVSFEFCSRRTLDSIFTSFSDRNSSNSTPACTQNHYSNVFKLHRAEQITRRIMIWPSAESRPSHQTIIYGSFTAHQKLICCWIFHIFPRKPPQKHHLNPAMIEQITKSSRREQSVPR